MFSSNKAYPFFLFTSIFVMITISGYILYQILPKNENFIFFSTPKKTIYFLSTKENEAYLERIGIKNNYENIISKMRKRITLLGYNTKKIYPFELENLTTKDIVFILDTYAISREEFFAIKKFLQKGGNIIFNYQFAEATNPLYLYEITNLKKEKTLSKKDISFFTFKMLSPISQGEKLKTTFITLYGKDTINTFSGKPPLLSLTNWALTSPPKNLNPNQSGILWNGYYKKGKWFYFSVPAYTFLDFDEKSFETIFKNIINFFTNYVTLVKYPFLDKEKAIFISEDTEYKYKNMYPFAKLAKNKEINTTLFCVAKLAQENVSITKEVAKFKNIEIASHSYSHSPITKENIKKEIFESKKILHQITKQNIVGFRPPREEINPLIEKSLLDAKYKYVMAKSLPIIAPFIKNNLVIIPRHGSDDYLYIIKYNFNNHQILSSIKKETQFLTSLNTLFTLSVHTHLLSNPQNISIIEKYFDYIKKEQLPTLTGKEIAKRTKLLSNISLHIDSITEKNLFIGISNDNLEEVNNFTFRIYYPNIEIKNIQAEVLKTKLKVLKIDKKQRYIDVRIKKLYPKSTISIIINY